MSRRKSLLVINQESQIQIKHQEELLSNEIDSNLRTLASVHPISNAAKPILVKDVFMKLNRPAFQHVVHYLIMIINATEYRKQFRWPIVSVRDETDFRGAALKYFNHCHKQFKWNFGPFKMQVVLFPCGVEFMRIIVELSMIAIRVTLNDNTIYTNSHGFISFEEAQAKLHAAEEAQKEMTQLCSKINELCIDVKLKTSRLEDLFNRLLRGTNFVKNPSFLSTWESNQRTIINDKMFPSLLELQKFFDKCNLFENHLKSAKSQPINIDKEKMKLSGLLKISQDFTNQLDYSSLFEWLKASIPDIINSLYFKSIWSPPQLKNESHLLERYIVRADDLCDRIDALRHMDHSLQTNCSHEFTESLKSIDEHALNYWNQKLVLTPTIKCPVKKDNRFVLWELMQTIDTPSQVAKSNVMKLSSDITGQYCLEDNILRMSLSTRSLAFAQITGFDHLLGMDTMVKLSSKLDPLSMLNAAMKGNNKTKDSPRRKSVGLSSPRLADHKTSVHSSTMLPPTDQNENFNMNVDFSPLRKCLF